MFEKLKYKIRVIFTSVYLCTVVVKDLLVGDLKKKIFIQFFPIFFIHPFNRENLIFSLEDAMVLISAELSTAVCMNNWQ